MTRMAFAGTRGGFHLKASASHGTRNLSRVLLLFAFSLGVLALGAQAASAATISLSADANPIEGQQFGITASGTADVPGDVLIHIERNEGGTAACGATRAGQFNRPAQQFADTRQVPAGPYSERFLGTVPAGGAGTYLVCGALLDQGKGLYDSFSAVASISIQVGEDPAAPPRPQSTISLKLNPNSTAPAGFHGSGTTSVTASGTARARGEVSLYFAAPTLYEGENNGNPSCPATEPSDSRFYRAGPTTNVTGPQPVADSGPYSLTFVAELEQGGRTQFCGYLRVHQDGPYQPETKHTASLDVVVQSNLPPCPTFSGLTILSAEQSSAPGAVGLAARAKVTYLAPSAGKIDYSSSLRGQNVGSAPGGGRNTSTFLVFDRPEPSSPGNGTVRFTFRFRSQFEDDPKLNNGCAKANQRTVDHLPLGPEQSFSVIFGTAGGLSASLYPSGPASQISSVLKAGGYSAPSTAAEPATYKVAWYAAPSSARRGLNATASAAAPVLIASGTRVARRAGKGVLKVRLTKRGKALLRKSKRLKVTIRGSVDPRRGKTVKKTTKTTLKR